MTSDPSAPFEAVRSKECTSDCAQPHGTLARVQSDHELIRAAAMSTIEELAIAIQGGSVDLMDELVNLLYSEAIAGCFRPRRSRIEFDDLRQEVSIRVLRRIRSWDPSLGPFWAWFSRITHNFEVDFGRRVRAQASALARFQEEYDECDPAGEPDEVAAPERLLLEKLRVALEGLTEPQRVAFVRHHIEAQRLAEIANDLGVSVNTIKKRVQAARLRLRKLLGDDVDL